MQKILLISACLFALTACKTEFEGRIDVNEAFRPKVSRGNKVVPVGTHDVSLKIKSKDKAELEVTLPGRNTNPRMTLKLKGSRLPEENGPVSILSRDSGQPFDIQGNLNTVRTRSDLRRGSETCSEQVPDRRCWRDHHRGHVYCENYWRTVYGSQDIEFYDEHTQQRLIAKLLKPNSSDELATIRASDNSSRRVVTYRSRCYWHRGW